MKKRYLGDGVYCEADPEIGALVLTTEDGRRVTNKIVLEVQVYEELIQYYKDLTGE